MQEQTEIEDDDSSDEEEMREEVAKYRIHDRYNAYMSDSSIPAFIRQANPEGYSFLSYAMGIEQLYSANVNAVYYPKRRSLGKATVISTAENLKKWLIKTFEASVHYIFLIENQTTLSFLLTERFIKEEASLHILIETMMANLHAIFKQRDLIVPRHALKILLRPLKSAILTFIQNLQEPINFEAPKSFNEESFVHDPAIQQCVLPDYTHPIQYLQSIGLVNQEYNFFDAATRRRIFATVTGDSHYKRCLIELAKSVKTSKQFPINLLTENRIKIIAAYIKDILALEHARPQSTFVRNLELDRQHGVRYFFNNSPDLNNSCLKNL